MASKLNSEFNYRYLVIGETVWEKIKTLKGFLEGRVRAAVLEEVGEKKFQAKLAKLKWLKETTNLEHEVLELEAEIMEAESFIPAQEESFALNQEEIIMLERLLAEAYEAAEPTRIEGYSDDQMFEANAANEFTMLMARTLQSEIVAQGRPLPATVKNAMCNPHSFIALKECGLIPADAVMLGEGTNPLLTTVKKIEAE
jgi:hypothetical protein